MSNGELNGSPWAGLELDAATFMGAVASERLKVELAAADVEAANERLIDEVRAAQRGVERKKKDLAGRQKGLKERLDELNLGGRPIEFEAGSTLGAADYEDPKNPRLDPKTVGEDLTGSKGTITGFEVGTHLGKPLDSPEDVVFIVEMDESSEMLCAGVEDHRYGIVASQADYDIGRLPGTDDQPQE